MKKGFLCIVLVLALLAGCKKPGWEKYSQLTITAGFDTSFTLIGYAKSEKDFDRSFAKLEELLSYYNQLFDKYHTYDGVANIKTINDNAGIKPVTVDPVLIDLLKLAKEFYDLSGGAFDVTAGKAMEIWHNYRTQGISANENGNMDPAVPSKEELEAVRVTDGWSHVIIDEADHTVYVDGPGVMLDVGGIAKGFACELLAKYYLDEGILGSGAINGGGNVRILAPKPDGAKWSIGVSAPNDPSSYAGTFYLSEGMSLVTSGDYQRYYTSGGVMYSHIMDPFTLECARNVRSVTVLTKDSGIADCLSTALFVLPLEDGIRMIEAYNASHEDQIGAYWVYDDSDKPDRNDLVSYNGYYVYATENIRPYADVYGASK
ncbi:MAG: FAD:protein FMN transferase [Erysipelotrichales bacterium]|nr:FAD:protein FMN transferase [Erysipelotrichales bacterium]